MYFAATTRREALERSFQSRSRSSSAEEEMLRYEERGSAFEVWTVFLTGEDGGSESGEVGAWSFESVECSGRLGVTRR